MIVDRINAAFRRYSVAGLEEENLKLRVAVVGGNGQLGRDLARTCPDKYELRAWDLPELDICDGDALEALLADYGPEWIINAAAYTDVERAEEEPEKAYAGNETGACNVARVAAALGVPVVYYSTDFVFDGCKRVSYVEDDVPNPLSVYGKSKLAGEIATARENPHHFILRTAWLYGPGGNNFVEKMLQLAATRDRLKVVAGETGSPTHTWDLASVTWRLCESEAYGCYHVVNEGACSRFEMTRVLFDLAGLSTGVDPCKASEFPTKARRPAHAPLCVDKIAGLLGSPMRSWQAALEHYLQRRKQST